MEKMIKIEIELDEEKILADNKYSPDELMSVIDEVFGRDGYPILEADRCRRVYRDKGDISHDVPEMSWFIIELAEKMRLTSYANKIMWYDNFQLIGTNEWVEENFLKNLIKHGVGVYGRK